MNTGRLFQEPLYFEPTYPMCSLIHIFHSKNYMPDSIGLSGRYTAQPPTLVNLLQVNVFFPSPRKNPKNTSKALQSVPSFRSSRKFIVLCFSCTRDLVLSYHRLDYVPSTTTAGTATANSKSIYDCERIRKIVPGKALRKGSGSVILGIGIIFIISNTFCMIEVEVTRGQGFLQHLDNTFITLLYLSLTLQECGTHACSAAHSVLIDGLRGAWERSNPNSTRVCSAIRHLVHSSCPVRKNIRVWTITAFP